MFQILVLPTCLAEVILDGSVGVSTGKVATSNNVYQITSEMGALSGNNLFHSFDTFNIETGLEANFSGPANVQNIIGRVTGTGASNIDGTLSSSIQGANLYLINPNGIMFGANASLNLTGSFYATTADYLQLGPDTRFQASLSENTSLSVAAPTEFGFIRPQSSDITVTDSVLQVGDGQTISLIGGDIDITAQADSLSSLVAASGSIELVSVASAGSVVRNENTLATDGFSQMGNIAITNTKVDAGGKGGGTVVIRGGSLVMNNALLYSSARGLSATLGKGIDVALRDDLQLNNGATLGSNVLGQSSDSAAVHIQASSIVLSNDSSIESNVVPESSAGSSGDINIVTNSLTLNSGGHIASNTNGVGNSGSVNIQTNSMSVSDGAFIATVAAAGTGSTGDVNIVANTGIHIFADGNLNSFTGIAAQTKTDASGADVNIVTADLVMDQGEISSGSFGSGNAGDISIEAKSVSVTGMAGHYFGIFATTQPNSTGDGGNLTINATDQVVLTNYASLQSSAFGLGNAGSMNITTDYLQVSDGAFASSAGFYGQGGNGGQMDISARHIVLSGLESAVYPYSYQGTGLISGAGGYGGDGGDINISAEILEMDNRATIKSSTFGSGAAGTITIDTGDISLLSGSQIVSGSYSSGNASDITIRAHNVLVSGAHPESFFDQAAGSEQIGVSGISAQSVGGDGHAGNISVAANKIELLDGGRITSDTFGAGNGGAVSLFADEIIISGESDTINDFLGLDPINHLDNGAGAGIYVSASSRYEAYFGPVTGKGGDINISADQFNLSDGAILASYADGAGDAGNVMINVFGKFLIDNATIATQSTQSNGGNIEIDGNSYFHLKDSTISASVLSQAGNGGSIEIRAGVSLLQSSVIKASAIEGVGGDISLQSRYIVVSADTEINASSEQSVDGVIEITPEINISNEFINLPDKLVEISLFNNECRAGKDQVSSLYYSTAMPFKNATRYSNQYRANGKSENTSLSTDDNLAYYLTIQSIDSTSEYQFKRDIDMFYADATRDCRHQSIAY